MKISQLLELRDRINKSYTISKLEEDLLEIKHQMLQIVESSESSPFTDKTKKLFDQITEIESAIKNGLQLKESILTDIREQVSKDEIKFFGDNYKLETMSTPADIILSSRALKIDENIKNEVVDRIRLYSSWKYPCLELGCRDGEWTENLVAGDPLYIVDSFQEFLDSTMNKFNKQYQQRLRPYIISSPEDLVAKLPNRQFSFIFCWNFMNYASFDTIKNYLKAAKLLLRPGGVFMFSYNDGDRPAGAAMAENFYMTYVPRPMLMNLCESMGFEIVQQRTRNLSVSWVELKEPGILSTVKAHQVLGEIKNTNL